MPDKNEIIGKNRGTVEVSVSDREYEFCGEDGNEACASSDSATAALVPPLPIVIKKNALDIHTLSWPAIVIVPYFPWMLRKLVNAGDCEIFHRHP